MNDIPDESANSGAGNENTPDPQAQGTGVENTPDPQVQGTGGDNAPDPKPKRGRKPQNRQAENPVEDEQEPPSQIVPIFNKLPDDVKAKFAKIPRGDFGDDESVKIKSYRIENASESSILIRPVSKNVPAKAGTKGVLIVDLDEGQYQKVAAFIQQRNIAKRGNFLTISEVV